MRVLTENSLKSSVILGSLSDEPRETREVLYVGKTGKRRSQKQGSPRGMLRVG